MAWHFIQGRLSLSGVGSPVKAQRVSKGVLATVIRMAWSFVVFGMEFSRNFISGTKREAL